MMSGRRIELKGRDGQANHELRKREEKLWFVVFLPSVVLRAERRRLRRENRELHKTKNTEQNVEHVEDSKAYSRVERE